MTKSSTANITYATPQERWLTTAERKIQSQPETPREPEPFNQVVVNDHLLWECRNNGTVYSRAPELRVAANLAVYTLTAKVRRLEVQIIELQNQIRRDKQLDEDEARWANEIAEWERDARRHEA